MLKRPATRGSTGLLPLPGLRLPKRGRRILVAVSGGLDSMVLLHVLNSLAVVCQWRLAVAHFNHCLRGRASDSDEAFVGKTSAAMNLPFYAAAADVKSIAAMDKVSIEMAARRLRHEFLARTAREHNIHTVAIAHHADDQVELFFLRLLRGAGGSGLGGMQWCSASPADEGVSLVRPLLDVPKAVLEDFARESKIRYREDATNRDQDFLRNRIRNELLPLLRRNYQSGLNRTIMRSMEIAAAEASLIAELAQAWLSHKPFWSCKERNSGRGSRFEQADFEELPVAIQRQVLVLQTIELGITPDFELIESMRLSPKKPVALSPDMSLLRDARGHVSERQLQPATFDDHSVALKLKTSKQTLFNAVTVKWNFASRPQNIRQDTKAPAGTEYFDANKVGDEIVLRHWRAGDRFQPIGLKKAAKLQDLFTNAKVPRGHRHELIVAEARSGIFWVEGLRMSEQFKLTAETQRVLTWRWRRAGD